MTNNALEIRSQKKGKAVLIYIALAVLLVVLNVYAFLADTSIAGIQMPMIEPDLENAIVRDTSTIEYFPRNMVIIQLCVIVLTFVYMKMSSKSYNIGFSMPEHKVGFWFAVAGLVIAIFYTLIKLSWKSAGYWYIGILILLSIVANTMFMALGLYLLRTKGAGRGIKFLLPFVTGFVLMAVSFSYETLFMTTYLTEYPFQTLSTVIILVFGIVAALITALFTMAFYLKTNLLSVSLLSSILFGVAVTSLPMSSMKVVEAAFSSDRTYTYLKLEMLDSIKTIGITEVICVAGGVAMLATAIVFLVLMMKNKEYPGDELCEYVPADPSSDDFDNCSTLLSSPRIMVLAIGSLVVLGYLLLSILWDHAIDISDFIVSGLEGLFIGNFLGFLGLLGALIAFVVILALLGAFIIAFFLFYQTKKNPHDPKRRIAWILVKVFVGASAVVDLVVAVLLFVPGFGGFLSMLPEDFYIWNHVLSGTVHSLNMTLLENTIPSIVFSAIFAVVMLIFAAYHAASFILVMDFEKNNGEGIRGKILYKAVFIATMVFAVLLFAIAPWFYQALDALVAMAAAGMLAFFAMTLRSIAKKN